MRYKLEYYYHVTINQPIDELDAGACAYSTLELYREFTEDAYSIALHPTGLWALVGFSDKLRLMNLFIDDVRPAHEFNIRGCREVSRPAAAHRALSR